MMESCLNSNVIDYNVNVEDLKKDLGRELGLADPQNALLGEKEHLQVYLRIRPLTAAESDDGEAQDCVTIEPPNMVLLKAPSSSLSARLSDKSALQTGQRFQFSQVYGPRTSQKELFEGTMNSLVKDVLDGDNSLVFTYGVTNSGKTFTFLGPDADVGILPRSLNVIFSSIAERVYTHMSIKPQRCRDFIKLTKEQQAEEAISKRKLFRQLKESDTQKSAVSQMSSTSKSSLEGALEMEGPATAAEERVSLEVDAHTKFSVWVSFCEIYNENIHDLLEPVPTGALKRTTLRLFQDIKGNSFVKDLRWVQVDSAEEAYKVMKLGRKNQSFSSTKLNQLSSRSHSIFSIRILRVDDVRVPRVHVSELCLCDLAGSERCAKTQNKGDRLKEAGNINTSLLILGKCLNALRHNQQSKLLQHVPFRESKLTHYLQGYFSGRGKACMMVNVNQCASMYDETLNVLKFSALAQKVVVLATRPLPSLGHTSAQDLSFIINTADKKALLGRRKSSLTGWESSLEDVQEDEDGECIESMMEETSQESGDEDTGSDGDKVVVDKDAYRSQEALLDHLREQLKREQAESMVLEAQVRGEVTMEFSALFSEMQDDYNERLAKEKEIVEERAERRMEIFKNLVKSTTPDHKEQDMDKSLDLDGMMVDGMMEAMSTDLVGIRKDAEAAHSCLVVTRHEAALSASELAEQLREVRELLAQKTTELNTQLEEIKKSLESQQLKSSELMEICHEKDEMISRLQSAWHKQVEDISRDKATVDSIREDILRMKQNCTCCSGGGGPAPRSHGTRTEARKRQGEPQQPDLEGQPPRKKDWSAEAGGTEAAAALDEKVSEVARLQSTVAAWQMELEGRAHQGHGRLQDQRSPREEQQEQQEQQQQQQQQQQEEEQRPEQPHTREEALNSLRAEQRAHQDTSAALGDERRATEEALAALEYQTIGKEEALDSLEDERRAREETLAALGEQRRSKEEALASLEDERRAREETLAALGEQRRSKEEALASLEDERRAREETLAALGEQRRSKEEALASLEEERRAREETLAALGEQKLSKEEALASLEDERRAREETLAALGEQRRSKEEALASLEEERRAREETLAALGEQRRSKEEALASLEEERRAREETLAALGEQTRSKEEALASLEEERRAREETLAALGEQKLSKEEALASLEEERGAREETLAALGEQKLSKEEALASLEEERGAREETLAALGEQRRSKEEALASLEEERGAREETLASLEEERRAREEALAALGEQRRSKEQALASLEEERGAREETLAALGEQKRSKDEALASLEEERRAREETLAALGEQRRSKEEALASLEEERGAREETLAALGEQRRSKEEALASLEEERRAREETLAALGEQRRSKEEALASLEEERIAREETLTALGEQKLSKEEALASLEEERRAREETLASLEEESRAREEANQWREEALGYVEEERRAKAEALSALEEEERRRLEEDSLEREQKAQDLADRLEVMEEQVAEQTVRAEQASGDLHAARTTLERHVDEIQEKNAQIHSLTQERQGLRQKLGQQEQTSHQLRVELEEVRSAEVRSAAIDNAASSEAEDNLRKLNFLQADVVTFRAKITLMEEERGRTLEAAEEAGAAASARDRLTFADRAAELERSLREKEGEMERKLAQRDGELEKMKAEKENNLEGEGDLQRKLSEKEALLVSMGRSLREAQGRREEEECQAVKEARQREVERRRELLAVAEEAIALKDAELEKRAQEINGLKEGARQESDRVKSVSLDLQRKDDDVSDLREKLADSKKQIQQVQKEICSMREEERSVKQKLSDLEKTKTRLQSDLAARDRTIQQLKTEQSSDSKSNKTLQLYQKDLEAKERVMEDMRVALTEQEETQEQMEQVLEKKLDFIQELTDEVNKLQGLLQVRGGGEDQPRPADGLSDDLRLARQEAATAQESWTLSTEKHQADRRKWLEEKMSLISQAKDSEDKRNQEMRRFADNRERHAKQQSQMESLSAQLCEKEQAMERWRQERDSLVSALEVQLQKLLSSNAEKEQLIQQLRCGSTSQPPPESGGGRLEELQTALSERDSEIHRLKEQLEASAAKAGGAKRSATATQTKADEAPAEVGGKPQSEASNLTPRGRGDARAPAEVGWKPQSEASNLKPRGRGDARGSVSSRSSYGYPTVLDSSEISTENGRTSRFPKPELEISFSPLQPNRMDLRRLGEDTTAVTIKISRSARKRRSGEMDKTTFFRSRKAKHSATREVEVATENRRNARIKLTPKLTAHQEEGSSPATRQESQSSKREGALQKIGDFLQSSPTLLGSKAKKMMSLVSGRTEGNSEGGSSSLSLRARRKSKKKPYRPDISSPMDMPPSPIISQEPEAKDSVKRRLRSRIL